MKEKLDLLTEQLGDKSQALRDHALAGLRQEVAGATSSMTSVPKPLKFMKIHYATLKEIYEKDTNQGFKVRLAFPPINQILNHDVEPTFRSDLNPGDGLQRGGKG